MASASIRLLARRQEAWNREFSSLQPAQGFLIGAVKGAKGEMRARFQV
jgi:hypothetical protein